MNTIRIFTFGCKVNQYDSQIFREFFLKKGYQITDSQQYDIAFINTCCVTIKAQNECKKTIKKLLSKGKKVWVSGCMVEKENISNIFPECILMPRQVLFEQALGGGIKTISSFCGHSRAFIKVVDGCENHCSYCIVPFVRGKIRSRRIADIREEIIGLINKFFCEFVITGIDLGAYGKDIGVSLKDLIKEISPIQGLKRLRLSSIELFHISDGLLDVLRSCENFCPSFHIPIQSGSSAILKMMGRSYTKENFTDCIKHIRSIWNNATITTDIMIGFPGETDMDFSDTLSVIEECEFLKVHLFPFSLHKQTSAAKRAFQISEKEKNLRMRQAFVKATDVAISVKKGFIGKRLPVFVEKKMNGLWFGYSNNYIPFLIDTESNLKGKIVNVVGEELVFIGEQTYLLSKEFSILP
ncbi:MAG TPA: MiaB/RimO family radical SAM methylthiotransferase [bacterium]|nr:MiaB/RimO family radical SAM methylthiotransferase [bacterium]